MKYKLPIALLLALMLSVPVMAQQGAVAADSTVADSIPPPAPVTDLRAFDTPDDHGHSITLEWTKSADDGAGDSTVLMYRIMRWDPDFVDTVGKFRDSVNFVTNWISTAEDRLETLKGRLKQYEKGKPRFTLLDSVVFMKDTVRVTGFSDTERADSVWQFTPDSVRVFTGTEIAHATATEAAGGEQVLDKTIIVTSDTPMLDELRSLVPGIIRPAEIAQLNVSVISSDGTTDTYQADSIVVYHAGTMEQVSSSSVPLSELEPRLMKDTISMLSTWVPALKDSLSTFEGMVKPLTEEWNKTIDRLPGAYAQYPNYGRFDSVGVVPAGSEQYSNVGEKERTSRDYLPDHAPFYYRVDALTAEPGVYTPSPIVGPVESSGQWFNTGRWPVFIAVLLFGFLTIYFVAKARKGHELYVRPLAGIEAVDDAIGRATEMGKPILYVLGLGSAADIATIASFTILARVAKRVAEYQTQLIVPAYDPIVMTVAQEVVKSAYLDAGRPDTYKEDTVFFVTQAQFAYVAAVNGIMLRELPATNVYMGKFFAESLILAETGAVAGAIQISGTDEIAQIPFFIVACDYTLIGEELYAASAYLGREPILLGSLKAQDYAKAAVVLLSIIGMVAASFGWSWFTELFKVGN